MFFLVKLPDFLNATTIPDEKLKVLLTHLDVFIEYLESKKEYFGELHYKDILPSNSSKSEHLPPPSTINGPELDINLEQEIEMTRSKTSMNGNEMEVKIE